MVGIASASKGVESALDEEKTTGVWLREVGRRSVHFPVDGYLEEGSQLDSRSLC